MSKSSIQRTFAVIRAIVNIVSKELGMAEIRTFSGIYLGPNIDEAPKKWFPFPEDVLTELQKQCRRLDDEPRWLNALISDTGMRLGEAVGWICTMGCEKVHGSF